MEAAPPSYESAIVINPWSLIAQYIPSNDLCSAALVCEGWHAIIAPHLWGNPASHFGTENDRVYGQSLSCLSRSHALTTLCSRIDQVQTYFAVGTSLRPLSYAYSASTTCTCRDILWSPRGLATRGPSASPKFAVTHCQRLAFL